MKIALPTFVLCGALLFGGVLAFATQSLPPHEIFERLFSGIIFIILAAWIFWVFNTGTKKRACAKTQKVPKKLRGIK